MTTPGSDEVSSFLLQVGVDFESLSAFVETLPGVVDVMAAVSNELNSMQVGNPELFREKGAALSRALVAGIQSELVGLNFGSSGGVQEAIRQSVFGPESNVEVVQQQLRTITLGLERVRQALPQVSVPLINRDSFQAITQGAGGARAAIDGLQSQMANLRGELAALQNLSLPRTLVRRAGESVELTPGARRALESARVPIPAISPVFRERQGVASPDFGVNVSATQERMSRVVQQRISDRMAELERSRENAARIQSAVERPANNVARELIQVAQRPVPDDARRQIEALRELINTLPKTALRKVDEVSESGRQAKVLDLSPRAEALLAAAGMRVRRGPSDEPLAPNEVQLRNFTRGGSLNLAGSIADFRMGVVTTARNLIRSLEEGLAAPPRRTDVLDGLASALSGPVVDVQRANSRLARAVDAHAQEAERAARLEAANRDRVEGRVQVDARPALPAGTGAAPLDLSDLDRRIARGYRIAEAMERVGQLADILLGPGGVPTPVRQPSVIPSVSAPFVEPVLRSREIQQFMQDRNIETLRSRNVQLALSSRTAAGPVIDPDDLFGGASRTGQRLSLSRAAYDDLISGRGLGPQQRAVLSEEQREALGDTDQVPRGRLFPPGLLNFEQARRELRAQAPEDRRFTGVTTEESRLEAQRAITSEVRARQVIEEQAARRRLDAEREFAQVRERTVALSYVLLPPPGLRAITAGRDPGNLPLPFRSQADLLAEDARRRARPLAGLPTVPPVPPVPPVLAPANPARGGVPDGAPRGVRGGVQPSLSGLTDQERLAQRLFQQTGDRAQARQAMEALGFSAAEARRTVERAAPQAAPQPGGPTTPVVAPGTPEAEALRRAAARQAAIAQAARELFRATQDTEEAVRALTQLPGVPGGRARVGEARSAVGAARLQAVEEARRQAEEARRFTRVAPGGPLGLTPDERLRAIREAAAGRQQRALPPGRPGTNLSGLGGFSYDAFRRAYEDSFGLPGFGFIDNERLGRASRGGAGFPPPPPPPPPFAGGAGAGGGGRGRRGRGGGGADDDGRDPFGTQRNPFGPQHPDDVPFARGNTPFGTQRRPFGPREGRGGTFGRQVQQGLREGFFGNDEDVDPARFFARSVAQAARFSLVYGAAYSALRLFTGAFQQGVQGAIDFERALTELNIATERGGRSNETFATGLADLAASRGVAGAEGVAAGARAIGLFGVSEASRATQERLAETSVDVATLAAALNPGASLEQLQTQLASITRSFNINPLEQERILDITSFIGRRSGIASADLLAGLGQIGTLGESGGFDAEQVAAIIGRIRSSTGQTPQAVSGFLSQVLSKANDPVVERQLRDFGVDVEGTTLAEQFEQLSQLELDQEQINRLVTLFGRGRSGQAAATIIRDFSQIEGLAEGARNDSEGLARRDAQQVLGSIGAELRVLGTQVLDLFTGIAESGIFGGLVLLVDGLQAVVGAVDFVVDAFNRIPSIVRNFGFVVAEAAVALALFSRFGGRAAAALGLAQASTVRGGFGAAGSSIAGGLAGAAAAARAGGVAGTAAAAGGLLTSFAGRFIERGPSVFAAPPGPFGEAFDEDGLRRRVEYEEARGRLRLTALGRATGAGLILALIAGVAEAFEDAENTRTDFDKANLKLGTAVTEDDFKAARTDLESNLARAREDEDFKLLSSDILTGGLKNLADDVRGLLGLGGSGENIERTQAALDSIERREQEAARILDEGTQTSPETAFAGLSGGAESITAGFETLTAQGFTAAQQVDALSNAFSALATRALLGERAVATVFAGQFEKFNLTARTTAVDSAGDFTRALRRGNRLNPGGRFLGENVLPIAGALAAPLTGLTGGFTRLFGGGNFFAGFGSAISDSLAEIDPTRQSDREARERNRRGAKAITRTLGREEIQTGLEDVTQSTIEGFGIDTAQAFTLNEAEVEAVKQARAEYLKNVLGEAFTLLDRSTQEAFLNAQGTAFEELLSGFNGETVTAANARAVLEGLRQRLPQQRDEQILRTGDAVGASEDVLADLRGPMADVQRLLSAETDPLKRADLERTLVQFDLLERSFMQQVANDRVARIDALAALAVAEAGNDPVARIEIQIAAAQQKLASASELGLDQNQQLQLAAQIIELENQAAMLLAERANAIARTDVDPRSSVDTAAANLNDARRRLAAAAPNSTEYFQALQEIRQAQVAQVEAELTAQDNAENARIDPRDRLAQIRANLRSVDRRIAALRRGLPAAGPLQDFDLRGNPAGTAPNPTETGQGIGKQLTQGLLSQNYFDTGATAAQRLISGVLASFGAAAANLPAAGTGSGTSSTGVPFAPGVTGETAGNRIYPSDFQGPLPPGATRVPLTRAQLLGTAPVFGPGGKEDPLVPGVSADDIARLQAKYRAQEAAGSATGRRRVLQANISQLATTGRFAPKPGQLILGGNALVNLLGRSGLGFARADATAVPRATADGGISSHSFGNAADIFGTPEELARVTQYLKQFAGKGLKELIYTPTGTFLGQGGRPFSPSRNVRNLHRDHIHAQVNDPSVFGGVAQFFGGGTGGVSAGGVRGNTASEVAAQTAERARLAEEERRFLRDRDIARLRSQTDPRNDVAEAITNVRIANRTLRDTLRDTPEYFDAVRQQKEAQIALARALADRANSIDNLRAARLGGAVEAARAGVLAAQREVRQQIRGTTAYNNAQAQLARSMEEYREALRNRDADRLRLASDLTDPVAQARIALRLALRRQRDNARAGRTGEAENDALAVREAQNTVEQAEFDQRFNRARVDAELGRTSQQSYLNFLMNEKARLEAIKNRTVQQQEQLDQVDQALKALNQQLTGQFNLGEIKVPTPFEVRRAIAERTQGVSQQDAISQVGPASAVVPGISLNSAPTQNVSINVNGGDINQVKQVLATYLGASAFQLTSVSSSKI